MPSDALQPEPDTKDRTWVLDRRAQDATAVESLASDHLHDVVHHLHDVGAR